MSLAAARCCSAFLPAIPDESEGRCLRSKFPRLEGSGSSQLRTHCMSCHLDQML